ncbi:MAG: hypothetical protein ACKVWV_14725 [Planctomycetota bacterium]
MRWIGVVLAFLSLFSCKVGKDSVLFVTRTNVAIDLDTQPATLDIGYKRDELVLAPMDDEGNVLPVMTTVGVDANPFSFGANHSFATGDAALVMSRFLLSEAHPPTVGTIDATALADALAGGTIAETGKRYYFGTNTVLGLGVQWNAEYIPNAIALGYKRKELALVPLGKVDAEIDPKTNKPDPSKKGGLRLASLIATAHSGTDVGDAQSTRAVIGQTFATGKAATNLAMHPEVRRAIGPSVVPNYDKAREEMKVIQDAQHTQRGYDDQADLEAAAIHRIVARYTSTSDAQKPQFLAEASKLGLLLRPPTAGTQAPDEFKKAISPKANGRDPAILESLRALEGFQPTSN